VKERYAVPFASTDYREAIDRPEVDVVSICTPDRLHTEQAIYAMEHGKHVLVEKPIGISFEQLGRLIETVRRTGVTFACCHNYRFRSDFSALRDMLVHGDIGQPFLVDSCYFQDLFAMKAFGPEYWRFKDPQDLFLAGPCTTWIWCVAWRARSLRCTPTPTRHWTFGRWRTTTPPTSGSRAGPSGTSICSWLAPQDQGGHAAEGLWTPGSLEAAGGVITRDIGEGPGDQPEVVTVTQVNSHHRQVAHLVECIRTGKRQRWTYTMGLEPWQSAWRWCSPPAPASR